LPKKILFFLDLFTLHFALADYLQKNTDYELYALVDVTDNPKSFFQNQKIVNFKKTWYYHDNIEMKKSHIDIEYLKNFEIKYNLNIKQLINNDRFFKKYNDYYNFTNSEINSILTQEGKLFEKIISDCKPDFLIMFQPSLRHEYFFYEVCKQNNVKPLIINPSLMGYKSFISEQINFLDEMNIEKENSTNKTFNDLQSYYNKNNINHQIIDYVENFAKSKLSLMNAAIEFLFFSQNSNVKTHYTYAGRTKLRVFFKTFKNKISKKLRENFIKDNLESKIPEKNSIYFPLQVEPDRNLLLGAPNFTNQIDSIKQISQSLPPNYTLCVKEHPGQNREWRDISFYKKIMEIPHVVLLKPEVPSSELYKKSSMVITAVGTSGFEALFYGKPVIVFNDTLYSVLPSVKKMVSFETLPNLIKNNLDIEVTPQPLEKLLSYLEKNSFNFDLFGYYTMQAHEFFHDSNLIDVKISEQKMKEFLEKNKMSYKMIGEEIIKKIHNYS
tara:strand:+ start:996 stop:2486 length:1491 start_codon:yes stop_codon:yes gene_type:complete